MPISLKAFKALLTRETQHGEQNRQMSVIDKVVECLTDLNCSFHVDRETSMVQTSNDGSEASFRIAIVVKEDLCIVIVYVHCPVRVPEGNKRREVADFLTRANYGLVIGNFEMDFQDGEVRYKSALEYADGILTTMMIEKLIRASASIMAHYFGGLMKVIYADMDPATAIREIETGQPAGNDLPEAFASLLSSQLDSSNDEVHEAPVIEIVGEDWATPVTPVAQAPEQDAPTPASTGDEANEEM